MRKPCFLLLIVLVCFSLAGYSVAADNPEAKSASTLDNLMAAYNGESNAKAKYEAFAQKADTEGYAKVANLFRAAAKGEEIHLNNHAKVIREMGGEPKATIEKADPKTTRENLMAAIKGESYERDTMYPEFIQKAREDKNRAAIRTFNVAKVVEGGHAKLYQEALDNLDAWKAKGDGFYVCPVCGNATATRIPGKCPVCFTPSEKFLKIS